ncbi:MAG: 16S rRNA (guanine(966)-N(2))-methyltransferase RsmD [candidate division WOR-3 bacterium]
MNIIGGIAKGHKIFSPPNVRPTIGKVREAIFSIIDVRGKSFLDLFAGSGAVGIEALSRGAVKTVFIERSKKATDYIKRNLKKTGFEAIVINESVFPALDKIDETFDFIFIDPPYDSELISKTLGKIKRVLKKETVIIIETRKGTKFSYNGFEIVKTKTYGDTSLTFLKR